MRYNYNWKNKEANFGQTLNEQVPGGTHVTFEIILKKEGKFKILVSVHSDSMGPKKTFRLKA